MKSLVQESRQRETAIKDGRANGIFNVAIFYYHREYDLPQDLDKALELWHWAGELGKASVNYSIGNYYCEGRGVERDIEKAK